MKHQIFIASYRGDVQWLQCCLASIKKYAVGFLPPVVNIPSEDVEFMEPVLRAAHESVLITTRYVRKNFGLRSEFMSAQIAMMRADEYCPEADFIFLLGSESVATGELTPEMYFLDAKPVMLISKYADLETCHPDCLCWRPGTERYLGWKPDYEFMRRLPCVYPRKIYEPFREHVAVRSPWKLFDEAIYRWDEIYKDTSEQNLLGAYAHNFFHDKYSWVDVGCLTLGQEATSQANPVVTFWSHGGLDRPCDLRFSFRGESVFGKTPREIIRSVLT